MARALGIQYPGAFYHVTCRGNEGRQIFLSRLRKRSQQDKEINHRFPALARQWYDLSKIKICPPLLHTLSLGERQ